MSTSTTILSLPIGHIDNLRRRAHIRANLRRLCERCLPVIALSDYPVRPFDCCAAREHSCRDCAYTCECDAGWCSDWRPNRGGHPSTENPCEIINPADGYEYPLCAERCSDCPLAFWNLHA